MGDKSLLTYFLLLRLLYRGFRTVSKGPRKGECSHALFVRGKPELCRSMVRVRNKTTPPERFYQQPMLGSTASMATPKPPSSAASTGSLNQSMISAVSANLSSPAKGISDLGAALVASLKDHKHGSGAVPSAAVAPLSSTSGTSSGNHSSLAPALVSLLQGLAGGSNSKPSIQSPPAAAASPAFPQHQQHNVLFPQQPPQPQLQQQTEPALNQQLLQLLALQQQASAPTAMPSNGSKGSRVFPTLATFVGSPSPPPSAAAAAASMQCQPVMAISSSSVENAPATAAQKLQNGAELVACRARGMAMEHNIHVSRKFS